MKIRQAMASKFAADMDKEDCLYLRLLLEAVRDGERRRCVGVARMEDNSVARDYRNKLFRDAKHPTGKHLCDIIGDEIERTGERSDKV